MKLVFICSTGGSVIKNLISNGFLKKDDCEIVSDRDCGAITFAKSNGLNFGILQSSSGAKFSESLASRYKGEENVLFISFYTRLLSGSFIEEHASRLINFHPSILPGCAGMDGFGDTLKSGALFIGSTVHLIDSGVDSGLPILQSAYPRDPNQSYQELRHRIYLQQSISLLQVVKWYESGRVIFTDNSISISGAEYSVGEFSPNLDPDLYELFKSWIKNKA